MFLVINSFLFIFFLLDYSLASQHVIIESYSKFFVLFCFVLFFWGGGGGGGEGGDVKDSKRYIFVLE